MRKSLFILTCLTLISSLQVLHAQGRAPAVEPEMGISIEEYEEVHSGPEKGFDFTQANPGVSADMNKQARVLTGQKQLTANTNVRSPNSVRAKEKAPSPAWTLIALTALPFGLWLLLRQTFPKDTGPVPQSDHASGSEGVTIDLASERQKRQSFEDDDEDKHTKVG